MRRRTLLIVGGLVALVLVAGGGVLAWRALPYVPPTDQPVRAVSVAREMAYVERWWNGRNPEFGSYGGTDCVNFTSQALLARGWRMDADWGTSVTLGRRASAAAWVSSTAMMRLLESRPDLATPVDATEVRPGDVAQFDWDGSGDRDHTAIVSAVDDRDGAVQVFVAEHSPNGLRDSVSRRLAENGSRARVYYWRLAD